MARIIIRRIRFKKIKFMDILSIALTIFGFIIILSLSSSLMANDIKNYWGNAFLLTLLGTFLIVQSGYKNLRRYNLTKLRSILHLSSFGFGIATILIAILTHPSLIGYFTRTSLLFGWIVLIGGILGLFEKVEDIIK